MNRVARAATASRISTREHALVYRLAALLLEYPTPELLALVPDVQAAADELADRFATPVRRLTDHLLTTPLPRLQEQYVETFDLRRRCSLYLTYYAYGDTRKRGVALVELKQAYRAAGAEVQGDELPDHLCVLLEFAATTDVEAGIRLLLAHRAGLELLRLALEDSRSPYADAVAAVCTTLPALAGDEREAVARLAAQGPPGEDVGLEPFMPPSTPIGARR